MLGWIYRIFIVLAGSITSWFVARDALNFEVIKVFVAVILFTIAVAIIAFWPLLKEWFKSIFK